MSIDVPDYSLVQPDVERRLLRGRVLLSILGLTIVDPPRYRDAWVEREQNPDKPAGVMTLRIAVYTESNGEHRERMAEKIFTMRAHPHYLHERDDTTIPTYTTFYFSVPAATPAEELDAMAARAVDPVNTDARWAQALLGMRGRS